MKISDLITALVAFQEDFGDLELESTYYCNDCQDEHTGPGVDIELTAQNKVKIVPRRLGYEMGYYFEE